MAATHPRKDAPAASPGDVLLLGTDGTHQPPSAQHGAATLHCACNQSPTFRTQSLSWGCARGHHLSGADLPFSWDLPHAWGKGWVLGWMLWPHHQNSAPRAPLQSAVLWSSSSLSCLRGERLSKASPVLLFLSAGARGGKKHASAVGCDLILHEKGFGKHWMMHPLLCSWGRARARVSAVPRIAPVGHVNH